MHSSAINHGDQDRSGGVPRHGASLNDLVAGQVDFGCDQIVNVAPHIQAGTIKAFGIATAERSAAMKDVPTTREGGLPAFEVSAWLALFAPKDTPQDVVA